jgi:hypothetical protein
MIHYVCVATESKLYFPYLKQLISDLVVLGMNMEWKGFIMKHELLTKYLKTINENDIVCFIDAYDVLPTKNIIHLEEQFKNFSQENPKVKMIVGYDKAHYKMHELVESLVFNTIDGDRINSGQFIGYVKNIKIVINELLRNANANKYDDQVELTKYIKKNKEDFCIDKEYNFFNVITTPLKQITNNKPNVSFVHANSNGMLEKFLLENHNINVNKTDKIKHYIENSKSIVNKIKVYKRYFLT